MAPFVYSIESKCKSYPKISPTSVILPLTVIVSPKEYGNIRILSPHFYNPAQALLGH